MTRRSAAAPPELPGFTFLQHVEPTPERDHNSADAARLLDPDPDYRTQNPPPPPLIDPEFENPATAKGKAKATADDTPPEPAAEPPGASTISELASNPYVIGGAVLASPFVLVALLAAIAVLLKGARRQRRRTRGAPHERIANGWREVIDLATDLGRPVPAGTTRREAAAFASVRAQPLAVRTDAAVWSGADLSDADVDHYWADLVATLKVMRSDADLTDRVKAAMSLQSLRRRTDEVAPPESDRSPDRHTAVRS